MLKAYSVLLLLVLLVASAVAELPCCVCEGCKAPKGPGSCGTVELDLSGRLNANDSQCKTEQSKHYEKCCGPNAYTYEDTAPEGPDPNSIEEKQKAYPQGSNEPCELCYKTNAFPNKPYTVTAVLYIPGNPTCEDLFFMGRQGTIPNRLCYPLQDYMQVPCGCDQGTGGGGGGAPPPSGGGGGSGGVPQRKKRPASANKNNLKLAGGRVRGATRRKLLKGQ